jgi:predicted nucleic acid-binding Zn ribbon protein
MRVDKLKIGNCIICDNEMPIFNKRQRFCSDYCRSVHWNKVFVERRKLANKAKKRDLFGFEIAA